MAAKIGILMAKNSQKHLVLFDLLFIFTFSTDSSTLIAKQQPKIIHIIYISHLEIKKKNYNSYISKRNIIIIN